MRSTINTAEQNEIWTEDPLTAYKNFLQYAGKEANAVVEYNRQALSALSFLYSSNKSESSQNPAPKELKVHAHNGSFYPLKTSLNQPGYCGKLTIRNLNNVSLVFNFRDDIIPRIVSIDATGKTAESARIAYRNIVPNEFSNAPQLAGPAGFSEYLIDGNGLKDRASISFFANSSREDTPLKIVLENCKGSCMVLGLDQNAVDAVFENKCGYDLKMHVLPPITETLTDDAEIESPSSNRKRF